VKTRRSHNSNHDVAHALLRSSRLQSGMGELQLRSASNNYAHLFFRLAVPSAPSSWPELYFCLHAKLDVSDAIDVIAHWRLTPYAFSCLCTHRGQAQRGPWPPTCPHPDLLPPRQLEMMFKNKESMSSHPWSSHVMLV
jgi:hypothetical protein